MINKKKYYGKAPLVGNKEFELLIEYSLMHKSSVEGYENFPKIIAIGKDVVTGTKLKEVYFPNHTIKSAIRYEGYKKNTLYVHSVSDIKKADFIDVLEKMTKKDIINYINELNKTKSLYDQAAAEIQAGKKANLSISKDLKTAEKRVKTIAKSIN